MTKVKVEVDQNVYNFILEKLPWLSYECIEDFVKEAIQKRFEQLLQLATLKP